MFGNKELEAGMLALNMRLDNMQKSIDELMRYMKICKGEIDLRTEERLTILQGINDKLAEKPPEDSPFKTKEGLFNYKQRKPVKEE